MTPRRALLASLLALLVSCGGGGGSGMAAPSDLSYPTPPAFVRNQAIATLRPTVTGTVSSYAVSPALPTGLTLDPMTGYISGTPTAVTPAASYTLTASNSAGSTDTSLALTVNDALPAFSYGTDNNNVPLSLNSANSVSPTNTGGKADSWSISPQLPAGLSLNTTDGTIAGMPVAAMAPSSFTVTASNVTGKRTADVTISVQQVLVDLGHVAAVGLLHLTGTRMLSMDGQAHWVLWDYPGGSTIMRGDVPCGPLPCDGMVGPIKEAELAGDAMAVMYPSGLAVRSAIDGSPLATLAVDPNSHWHLATDGSYVCDAARTGLTVWSPTGAVIVSRPGDYSGAIIFCAPDEVRIALGPAGANVIETIAVSSGVEAVSPTFQGIFSSWFVDGDKFLTSVSDTVWVYSKASAQLDFVTLATVSGLAGQGAWFWTYDDVAGALNLYQVGGGGVLAASYPLHDAKLQASGLTIGVFEQTTNAMAHVIDLSNSTPSITDYPGGIAGLGAYAANSGSQWVAGSPLGVLIDGPTLSGTPRYFNYGAVLAVAGSSTRAAAATASGRTLIYNTSAWTLESTLAGFFAQLALSSDGTAMAARTNGQTDSGVPTNTSVTTYSLPSAAVLNTWTYGIFQAGPYPEDLSLSASGSTLGQVIANGAAYARKVTGVSGGAVLWSDSGTQPIRLSPDGTLVAASDSSGSSASTKIYLNGSLVTAVPGWAVNWLSDNSLLINSGGSVLYDAGGNLIGDSPLGALAYPTQVLGPDSLYQSNTDPLASGPGLNTIYSVTTGAPTWVGPRFSPIASSPLGAVAGPRVVFVYGSSLVAQPY